VVTKSTETEAAKETSTEMTQPVVIDLGRKRSRSLTELKNGEGKLWDEVLDVIEEVKDLLGKDADGKVLVPVVMIYERIRPRRVDLERILFPLLRDEDFEDEEDDENDEEEED
jgi:hypothetical protein